MARITDYSVQIYSITHGIPGRRVDHLQDGVINCEIDLI